MKKFEELTTRELVALTQEQLQQYIDIKCMECGVVKPLASVAPIVKKVELNQIPYYGVKINYTTILFKNIKDAETFVDMSPRYMDSLYNSPEGYDKRAKPAEKLIIERIMITDENDIMKHQEIMTKQKKEREEYQKDQKAYESQLESLQEIADEVLNTFYAAQRQEKNYETIKRTYDDYLKLCENKKEIALNFLEKVYSPNDIKEAFEWFEI